MGAALHSLVAKTPHHCCVDEQMRRGDEEGVTWSLARLSGEADGLS